MFSFLLFLIPVHCPVQATPAVCSINSLSFFFEMENCSYQKWLCEFKADGSIRMLSSTLSSGKMVELVELKKRIQRRKTRGSTFFLCQNMPEMCLVFGCHLVWWQDKLHHTGRYTLVMEVLRGIEMLVYLLFSSKESVNKILRMYRKEGSKWLKPT